MKKFAHEEKKNGFLMFVKKIGNLFSRTMFPEDIKCVFCGNDVPDFENKPFCSDCEKVIEFNNNHKCKICAEPIGNEALVCDSCQKNKRAFKKAFAPLIYAGKVRSAILAYKDSNHRYKAKSFAKFIYDDICASDISFDAIVFVPLSKKKTKVRSFNQAELLANHLGKMLDVPVLDVFDKVSEGRSQKHLSFEERKKNSAKSFALKKNAMKNLDSVLIVDDIITTGATIDTCASLLLKKVKNIYVAAIARNKRKGDNQNQV